MRRRYRRRWLDRLWRDLRFGREHRVRRVGDRRVRRVGGSTGAGGSSTASGGAVGTGGASGRGGTGTGSGVERCHGRVRGHVLPGERHLLRGLRRGERRARQRSRRQRDLRGRRGGGRDLRRGERRHGPGHDGPLRGLRSRCAWIRPRRSPPGRWRSPSPRRSGCGSTSRATRRSGRRPAPVLRAGTSLIPTSGNYVDLSEQFGCLVLDKGGTLFPTDKNLRGQHDAGRRRLHCLVAEFDGATGNAVVRHLRYSGGRHAPDANLWTMIGARTCSTTGTPWPFAVDSTQSHSPPNSMKVSGGDSCGPLMLNTSAFTKLTGNDVYGRFYMRLSDTSMTFDHAFLMALGLDSRHAQYRRPGLLPATGVRRRRQRNERLHVANHRRRHPAGQEQHGRRDLDLSPR